MMKMIATVSRTNEILKKYDLYAKKKYGQNFIIEPNIISRIVSSAGIDENTTVIEIGPGIGALSQGLSQVAKQVIAFEIDEDMIHVLNHELCDQTNFKVIHQDFLKINLNEVLKGLDHVKVVANLPYYITSKLLEKLALEGSDKIEELIVMVQKDVATKMAVSDDLRDRLPLTLFLKSIGDVELLFDVPRTVFMPSPHVDSAILRVTFHKESLVEDKLHFYSFLKIAFNQRRKTLGNNLKQVKMTKPLDEILEEMDLPSSVRSESLSIKQLYHIFKYCTF